MDLQRAHVPPRGELPGALARQEEASEVHKSWHMTTGRSVEAQEPLAKESLRPVVLGYALKV